MKPSGPIAKSLPLIFTLIFTSLCQQQPSSQPTTQSNTQQIFKIIIIVGGYVAILIGAIIYRLQARQSKVIQFEEVGARGGVSSTEHKFQQLQEEIENSAVTKPNNNADYEIAGGDSTKRKRRKRKADRLSDRRKNNQSIQSNQNHQEGDD